MSESPLPKLEGFHVLRAIGRGGMGDVYLAESDRWPGRRVAVKVLRHEVDLRHEELKRFLREGRLGRGLAHPCILPVLAVDAVGDTFYIVMDYVEGETLAERIAATGSFEPPSHAELARRLDALARIADALQYAHDHGIVHRDVKPGNILLRHGDDQPFLIDFGLARNLMSESSVTTSGAVVGTPCYMSPEQLSGDNRVIGPATDLYALGVTLFQATTGQVPFTADSLDLLLPRVLFDEPPRIKTLAPDSPAELEPVVLRALEKKPQNRYPSAGALRDDIMRVLEGGRIHGASFVFLRRAFRRGARHRFVAALAALVLVAGLGAGLLHRARDAEATRVAEQVRYLFDQVQLDLENGELGAALAHVDEASALTPKRPEGALQRAAAYARFGHEPGVADALAAAAELGFLAIPADSTDDPQTLFQLGLYDVARGELEAARAVLLRAADSEPASAHADLLLSWVERELGRADDARRHRERYRQRLQRGSPHYPILEAQLLELDGDPERAVELLEQYRDDPGFDRMTRSRVHHYLGKACLTAERYVDGECELREALTIHPQNGPARVHLGVALIQQGRIEESLTEARTALRMNASLFGAETIFAGAARRLRVSEPERAATLLQEALRRRPDLDAEALIEAETAFQLGAARRQHSSLRAARARFEECISLDPDHPGARTLLAEDRWLANDLDGAAIGFEAAHDAWVEAARARPVGLLAWRRFQLEPVVLHQIQIGRLSVADGRGDNATADAAWEAIEGELERDVRLSKEAALNLAEFLATAHAERRRDCSLARRLVDDYDLREAFAGDRGAQKILDTIDARCP